MSNIRSADLQKLSVDNISDGHLNFNPIYDFIKIEQNVILKEELDSSLQIENKPSISPEMCNCNESFQSHEEMTGKVLRENIWLTQTKPEICLIEDLQHNFMKASSINLSGGTPLQKNFCTGYNLIKHEVISEDELEQTSIACNLKHNKMLVNVEPHKLGQHGRFLKNGGIVQHIGTQTRERPFKCNLCDYSTQRNYSLVEHIRTHTKEKLYKCELCNYSCPRKPNLVVHIRSHTGEKPYNCTLCDHRTSRKHSLLLHIRSHVGETPFKCGICNYSAGHKGNLRRHLKTHSRKEPFKCETCNYRTLSKTSLLTHCRTHMGETVFEFKCKVCDYSSSNKSNLVVHIRTHTGETPFKCKICNYGAGHKGNLMRHLRTHRGKQPFKSGTCEYST